MLLRLLVSSRGLGSFRDFRGRLKKNFKPSVIAGQKIYIMVGRPVEISTGRQFLLKKIEIKKSRVLPRQATTCQKGYICLYLRLIINMQNNIKKLIFLSGQNEKSRHFLLHTVPVSVLDLSESIYEFMKLNLC